MVVVVGGGGYTRVPHFSSSSFLHLSSSFYPLYFFISVAAVLGCVYALVPRRISPRFSRDPRAISRPELTAVTSEVCPAFYTILRSLLCKNWLSDLVGSSTHGRRGPSPCPSPVLVNFHGIEPAFSFCLPKVSPV